jgi:hypothetical protein
MLCGAVWMVQYALSEVLSMMKAFITCDNNKKSIRRVSWEFVQLAQSRDSLMIDVSCQRDSILRNRQASQTAEHKIR